MPQSEDRLISDGGHVDYAYVKIPDKEPSEYDWRERRADLYMMLREAGSPERLPRQEALGERYDVSQPQISQDFDRLAEYGARRLGDRERELWETDLVVRRCIRGMLEEEEWREAARTALEREEWRAGAVDLTELHERVERLDAVDGGEVM
jgi:hypothetical protein